MDDVFPDGLPAEPLFHYTSQAGLLGILKTKTLWATDILYLNDSMEFLYTFGIAKERIRQMLKVFPKHEYLLHALEDGLDQIVAGTRATIFVISFADAFDQLGLWRGYCPGGNGFSIGLDMHKHADQIQAQGFRLRKCIYDPDFQCRDIDEQISAAINWGDDSPTVFAAMVFGDRISYFFDYIISVAPRFKHNKFEEEHEWRLVSKLTEYSRPEVNYREGKSLIVPYFEFQLAEETQSIAVSKVMVGPAPHPHLSKLSIENLMKSNGISGDIVESSSVPYRSW